MNRRALNKCQTTVYTRMGKVRLIRLDDHISKSVEKLLLLILSDYCLDDA